ncbi:hypothetical protein BDN67DRAFT_473535 [Paxillus ammoniavirescens]|nr:hypothetical protein BDN67DRAFT_473535 [Paxillus ammoniavirescens]
MFNLVGLQGTINTKRKGSMQVEVCICMGMRAWVPAGRLYRKESVEVDERQGSKILKKGRKATKRVSNVSPPAFIQLVRGLAFRAIGTIYQFSYALFRATCPMIKTDEFEDLEELALICGFFADYIPLRRNIRVDEECDRICPPIGLRAPPATKVIVAPGSARNCYQVKSR